jgi:UDP-glucose 4-epimerase
MLTWTVGSGGLIGSAIHRTSTRAFTSRPVPWHDPTTALQALTADLDAFTQEVADGPWAIIWAAGAITTGSTDEQATTEVEFFATFLRAVRDSRLGNQGTFFLCSSAGGVHAGSAKPPFDESTPAMAISAYGRARLAQEAVARELLRDRTRLVIGRISNVYGPGQKLDKLQGLISRLAISSITRQPLSLFVPLSTVRDYVYVDDVAGAVHGWVAESLTSSADAQDVRIIASGQGTSIGQLLRIAQGVGHRRVPVAMASHPSSAGQAADLRFAPSVNPLNPHPTATSMPIGMKATFDDIRWRLQHATTGRLSAV